MKPKLRPPKMKKKPRREMAEAEVKAYLRAHPEFLAKHPELLEALAPPERQHGGNVEDFQHFALRRLQDRLRRLKGRFDGVVASARDNASVQRQVQAAALAVVRARTLDRLLEAVTVDFVRLFDVDVVRLAMESEAAGLFEISYPEERYSGVVFIPPGEAAASLKGADVRLVADTAAERVAALSAIFSECAGLVRSCALLRLRLRDAGREALLAFGVRNAGQFHPDQGSEMLHFLAQVLEERLSAHVGEGGADENPVL